MIFKEIKVSELIEFIDSPFYKNSDVLPISPQRAISQANNPLSDKDDIALILAVDKEILAGYIGIIPDAIHYNDKVEKAYWLSCWWINSLYRGTGLGPTLLTMGIERYLNIIVTQFATGTEKIYLKTGLVSIPLTLKGKKAVLRFNFADLLEEKKPGLKFILTLLKMLDGFLNLFQDARLRSWANWKNKNYQIQYISSIDKSIEEYIVKYNTNELFKRSPAVLNWILKYLWILPEKDQKEISKKYFFSSIAKRFLFKAIKVLNTNNEVIGFVVLQLRNNNMKVPYLYFNEGCEKIMMEVITREMILLRASMITLYNEKLGATIKDFPFPFKKDTLRPYFFSRNLENLDFSKYHIQDGDGDCAFT